MLLTTIGLGLVKGAVGGGDGSGGMGGDIISKFLPKAAVGVIQNEDNAKGRFQKFFMSTMGWNAKDVEYALVTDKGERILSSLPKLSDYVYQNKGSLSSVENYNTVNDSIKKINTQGGHRAPSVFDGTASGSGNTGSGTGDTGSGTGNTGSGTIKDPNDPNAKDSKLITIILGVVAVVIVILGLIFGGKKKKG
jgi:cobalamin biosynthesis Mg chelatase CobN